MNDSMSIFYLVIRGYSLYVCTCQRAFFAEAAYSCHHCILSKLLSLSALVLTFRHILLVLSAVCHEIRLIDRTIRSCISLSELAVLQPAAPGSSIDRAEQDWIHIFSSFLIPNVLVDKDKIQGKDSNFQQPPKRQNLTIRPISPIFLYKESCLKFPQPSMAKTISESTKFTRTQRQGSRQW